MIKKSVLLELTERAQWLGLDLMLGDEISLIKYDKNGSKIVSETTYKYQPDFIEEINAKLEKVAHRQRRHWESEFLRFAPYLPKLGWVMIPEAEGVIIIEAKNQGTEDEVLVASFGYNEIAIQHLSDLIASALIEDFENNTPDDIEDDLDEDTPEETTIEMAINALGDDIGVTGAKLIEMAKARGLNIEAIQQHFTESNS